jgi:hypothetical protein
MKIINFFKWLLAPEKLEQNPVDSSDKDEKEQSFFEWLFSREKLESIPPKTTLSVN